MAQFKSSAREGSFSNNVLQQPDVVKNIQAEGNRQLKGINAHQQQLQQLRSIALQAQKGSQALERNSNKTITNVEVDNLERNREVSKDIWDRQLAKEEAKNKNKIDKFGALVNFSKIAIDITADLKKTNLENQARAIKQRAYKYGVNSDTLRTIEGLDASMNKAEFQRSAHVQNLIKEGASQELIEFHWNDLYKGGGYKNYVDNADVLRRQGISVAQTLYEGIDPSLSPEEKRKWINQKTTEASAGHKIDGKEVSVEILDKYYWPAIREAERKALNAVSSDVRQAAEYESRATAVSTVLNTLDTGDGVKRYQQTLQLITDNPNGDTRRAMVSAILNDPRSTVGVLNTLLTTEFGDGRTLLNYPDEYAAIDNAIDRLQAEEQAEFLEGEKIKELQITVKLQESFDQNADSWDQKKQDELERLSEELGGPGYINTVTEKTQRYVIEDLAAEEIRKQFTRRLTNGTATKSYLKSLNLPVDLEIEFMSKLQTLESLKSQPEYTQALTQIQDEIESSVTTAPNLKFGIGRGQDNSVQWKIDQSEADFKRLLSLYSITNPGNAIRMAKEKVITDNVTALSKDGAIEQGKITEYYKYLDTQKASQEKARAEQKQITALAADPVKRKDPNNWAKILNQENFIEQVESYRVNGESQYLSALGAQMKAAPWEVVEFMAPAIDGVGKIDAPRNWADMLPYIDDQDRFVLFGGSSTEAAQLRVLQRKAEQATGISRNPAIRESFSFTVPDNVKSDTHFMNGIRNIAAKYKIKENDLLRIISFETGGTYNPAQRNKAGSGATGLIQFMESTARGLGTTTEALAKMSRTEQLQYVDKYLSNKGIEGGSYDDLYMAVLFPAAVGKSDDFVLFGEGATISGYGAGSSAYSMNSGLDTNKDGKVTKSEAAEKAK